MPLPNFFIVGAAKAGTTALHFYLNQHPALFMSAKKEANFFAMHEEAFDIPEAWATENSALYAESKQRFADNQRRAMTARAAYENLFAEAKPEMLLGEAAPFYMYHPRAMERIAAHCPDAKIIVLLRHPVDRAFSQFLQWRRDGREPCVDFEEALAQEPVDVNHVWWGHRHYIRSGRYAEQVARLHAHIAPDCLQMFLFDSLQQDPVGVLNMIFQFLQVDNTFTPDISLRYNMSGLPKSKAVHRWIMTNHALRRILKRGLPMAWRKMFLHRYFQHGLHHPVLAPDIRQRLTARYFAEDLEKLAPRIEPDISHWS